MAHTEKSGLGTRKLTRTMSINPCAPLLFDLDRFNLCDPLDLHLFTAYFLTLTSTQPPVACSMMLFPFLHIPSIPSPNYVIVVAPTWAFPVWTLGLCWTVRPGRIWLGFPPLLCTCALVVPSP